MNIVDLNTLCLLAITIVVIVISLLGFLFLCLRSIVKTAVLHIMLRETQKPFYREFMRLANSDNPDEKDKFMQMRQKIAELVIPKPKNI